MSIPFERKPFTPVGLAEGTTSTEKEAKKSQAVVIHAYGIGSGGFQVRSILIFDSGEGQS